MSNDYDNSIKEKTIRGLTWSFVNKFSTQISSFIIGIFLARLLTPKEFGLIGMLTIFITLSQVLVNGGFNQSLIRKKNVTEQDYNTVFIFNLVVSIFLYLLIFYFSNYIAIFYDEPKLSMIMKILSLGLIINALTIVQLTKIKKRIDFKLLTKVSIIATIISGVSALILAINNFGVWALVWRNLIQSTMTVLLLWRFSNWTPNYKFNIDSFKELFSFGSRLTLNAIIGVIFKNSYYVVIGKYYNAAILGQFTRAQSFKNLPTLSITGIVQNVTFPVLSEIQDDRAKLRRAYQRLIKSIMLITIPSLFILSVIAKELTVILMGSQWMASGEYLQILCYSAIFFPLDALNSNMLKIMNRADLILKIGIWRKLLILPLLLIIIYIGMKPFLYGLVIHQIFCFMMISNYSKKFINYGTIDQMKDILPIVLVNLVLIIILTVIGNFIYVIPILKILIQLFIGVSLFFATLEYLKFESYLYLKKVVTDKLGL